MRIKYAFIRCLDVEDIFKLIKKEFTNKSNIQEIRYCLLFNLSSFINALGTNDNSCYVLLVNH